MDFQQIRDFVNPAVAQATGIEAVENLSMPVPVAYVPVQLVIDGALSLTSENPVQNKVIAVAIQQLDGRITAIEGQFSEGVTEAVNNWLAAHPEATTTVQDGAITYAKLDSNLKGEVDQISELKSALQETLFAENCPFIKELYINEDGVSAGIAVVNSVDHNAATGTYRVRFADANLSGIIANATFTTSNLYEPVPILRQNIVRGYILLSWEDFEGTGTTVQGKISEKAFHLDYSPTIASKLADYQGAITENKNSINDMLFVDNCPFIKELYVNSLGIENHIEAVNVVNHNATTGNYTLTFMDTGATEQTGVATFSSDALYDLTPIKRSGNICGYVIMSWESFSGTQTHIAQPLHQRAFNLDFSPTIANAIRGSGTDQQIAIINNSINTFGNNLQAEETARINADNALGARIDNLVAPTGQSVAEITDARVGADGVIYASLEARLNAEYGFFNKKISKIRTVGVGQEYQTIQSAVDASSNGDVIIVFPGTYYEAVSFPRKSLCLIGTVRDDVILQYDNNDYNFAALEMCQGVLMNMTVRAFDNGGTPGSSGKAYAMHCDFQSWGIVGGMLYCENVKFIGDNFRAVGMGLRGQSRYEFVNCVFSCLSEYEALYAHDANNTNYDIANQSASFKNCTFVNNSSTRPTISMTTQEKQIGVASIEWQRNIVVNKSSGGLLTMSFYRGQNIGGGGWMDSSDWVLLETSALNTVQNMNYGAS